jgi:membrane fusion protein, multidrug efflux system
MLKKIALTALGLLVIVGVIVGVKVLQIKTLISTKPPVQREAVATYVVKKEHWRETITSVGSLSAVQGVTVPAELDGKIVEIDFEAGAQVKAGDVLLRQDTSVEQAQLRSAEAAVELARINLQRTQELFAKATVSQAQLDTDAATEKQALAAADNIRALIAKKTIKAPFSGRLGIRLVNLGQSLKAGDGIVSLQSLDPVYVDFYVPQQEIARLSAGLDVVVTADGLPAGGVSGKVTAVNPDVDTATRNVRVQATLANADGRLHPGMFVNIAVNLPAVDDLLVIPSTAVMYAPFGDTVWISQPQVVDGNATGETEVRQQIVRLGRRQGDFIAVLGGIKEGDTIVSAGVFRLRPGALITVNNPMGPEAKMAPTPKDS